MRYIIFLTTFFCLSLSSAQNREEFIFKFNVKKWNRDYKKHNHSETNQPAAIKLVDVNGKEIIFNLIERSISEEKLPNIKILKGKSADDQKIISLTVLPKSMNGSFLENGRQYFIEPVKNKCNTYLIYSDKKKDELEVGQIKDFVE